MKKYSILFCLFLQMEMAFAQAPEKMSYQAVVRNNSNVLVSNHAVGMRISILQGSATGTAVYSETQTPTTNANGLIAIEIGTGTVVTGSFANIDWANGPYFVKTETDPNGGTAYPLTSSNQLLSVPYALYAKTAGNVGSGLPSGAQQGQSLTMCDGQLVWATGGLCPAKIVSFNCADTVHIGNLVANQFTGLGTNTTLSYNGGNGGVYNSQNINSTGVSGLTAILNPGKLNSGNGSLTFSIVGMPNSNGKAFFTFEIGGKTCTFCRNIYLNNETNISCNSTSTLILNLISPITGKTWMDRNLGASRVASNSTDSLSYGDLYQWGRRADGHQCRNSATTRTLSSTDQPPANFIISTNSPYDWRFQNNDNLWQGINGINNPCPSGYRLPTNLEWESELNSVNQNGSFDSLFNFLKIPLSGYRNADGSLVGIGLFGQYWSSSVEGSNVRLLSLYAGSAYTSAIYRALGQSVRCIKD